MKRQGKEQKLESAEGLRFEYKTLAAWFWFRAADKSEELNSTVARLMAKTLLENLQRRGIQPPSPQEIYQYAAQKWPAHRLHDAPKVTK